MAKMDFGYRVDKKDERGGSMTPRMGKAGYPKIGPKNTKLEGPGCQDDCMGPGGGKGEDFGGDHG